MYNNQQPYHACPYYGNTPTNNWNGYRTYPCPYFSNQPVYNQYPVQQYSNHYYPVMNCADEIPLIELKDYGPKPFVVNIEAATTQNNTFRTALWTGKHLQLTLMSIRPGEDIGIEVHPHLDQFVRIEEGQGLVKMGDSKQNLNFQKKVYADYAFIIPAGKWHNLINTGNEPLKLYSIYAPPQHPYGTVHETREIAKAAER